MKRILLFLCAAMLAAQAWAETTFEVGDLKYTVIEGTTNVSVGKASTPPSGELSIPEKVTNPDNSEEYTVTSIGSQAFKGCSSLTSVTVPNSVTNIGEGAFSGCSGLTSISLPFVGDKPHNPTDTWRYPFGYVFGKEEYNGSAFVHQYFYGNEQVNGGIPSTNAMYFIPTNLKNVVITSSNHIPYGAFEHCQNLVSITLPNTVTDIDRSVFPDCLNLTEIEIQSGNPKYVSKDGVLFNKEMTIIICYPAGKKEKEYVIPTSVTNIYYLAFSYCSHLEKMSIPNRVISISKWAFRFCTGLTSVTIPNSVTSIGDAAFYNCRGLTSVTIPNSVTSIGDDAFYGCTGLTSITIPLLSGKAIETNFATLKNTILYFESENPQSQFSSSSIYTKAKNNVKATYVGCKVIRAAVNDEECGSVATSGEKLAVKGDDGSLWYLKETKNGSATLTATPAEGFHFVRWDDDDESATDNPRNVTVTQSRTYTAVFEADEPTALAANDTQEMKVATAHGAIVITNATSEVWVYDIAGQCIAHELPAQKITISPNKKGLFVVKSPSARVRVMVY